MALHAINIFLPAKADKEKDVFNKAKQGICFSEARVRYPAFFMDGKTIKINVIKFYV